MTVDLKDRVGTITAGNANLIVNKGDLITGDGEQCVYLRADTGANGDVLTLDNTADEGFSWQPGGGGGGLLTTKGDLLTHNGVTAVRLPVGADGDVLTADSTQPDGIKWAAGGGGGGSGASAMFYGLTAGTGNGGPTDYAATVAVKTALGTGRVPFPRDGSALTGVTRVGGVDPSAFVLLAAGTYKIDYKVHTTETGQLVLELDGAEIAQTETVDMNPTSGGHLLVGSCLLVTTLPNQVLAVVNPTGNSTALTITPADGGRTHANAQSITITQPSSVGATGPTGPAGPGTTGSNGVTVVANNATNDLVTGTSVAQINGVTPGDIDLQSSTGAITIAVLNDSGAGLNLTSNGGIGNGDVNISADTTTGTVTIAGGSVNVNGTNAINISPSVGASVTVTTGTTGDLILNLAHDELDNITRDETHVIGRNLSMTAAGSLGITLHATHATAGNVDIASDHGDVILEAPDVTNKLQLQTVATALISEYGGTGSVRSAAIINAAGGVVIDAEARTAINALLTYFRLRGTIAP